jgi:uncharacterized protein (DUF58 family)
MTNAGAAHHDAVTLASSMPPLLVEARRLAAAVLSGQHGRRRVGSGEEFWQFRPFVNGIDRAGDIDWRRSAKSDQTYVRQNEWTAPQTLSLWVDPSASMRISDQISKTERAAVIALALGLLAMDAGEKVAEIRHPIAPGRGQGHLVHIHDALMRSSNVDYLVPEVVQFPQNSNCLLFSDFLGDLAPISRLLEAAKVARVRGVLVQILTRQEIEFRFNGASLFSSALGGVTHLTHQAKGIRTEYLQRLSARRDFLEKLAQSAGWGVHLHCLDDTPFASLLALYSHITERTFK